MQDETQQGDGREDSCIVMLCYVHGNLIFNSRSDVFVVCTVTVIITSTSCASCFHPYLSVCSFVCLLARWFKRLCTELDKMVRLLMGQRTSWINFGADLDLNLGPGDFLGLCSTEGPLVDNEMLTIQYNMNRRLTNEWIAIKQNTTNNLKLTQWSEAVHQTFEMLFNPVRLPCLCVILFPSKDPSL